MQWQPLRPNKELPPRIGPARSWKTT
jgi:hypothetical protein